MTIIFQGHVEKLELGHKDGIKVTVRCDSNRMDQPIVVEASKAEADIYKPGTPLKIQIHPA